MAKAKKSAKKAKKQTKQQLVIAVLSRARDLIAKGWTRKTGARDKRNKGVLVTDPSACKFCAFGAICRGLCDLTGDSLLEEKREDIEQASLVALGFKKDHWEDLFYLNDTSKSSKPVLALFDEAIARLETAS